MWYVKTRKQNKSGVLLKTQPKKGGVLKNEAQNANANDKRKWMDACGNG